MNRAFADSPDNVFKRIAAAKRHPCAHVVNDSNGLVTVTFVHVWQPGEDRRCSRCSGIMPLTFWQCNPTPPAEQIPS